MIKHYLLVALARFRNAPIVAAVNVLALALGLACFIMSWGAVSYWLSSDQQHDGADRIYTIIQETDDPNGPQLTEGRQLSASAARLATDLSNEFPDLEAVARIMISGEVGVSTGETKLYLPYASADPSIVDLLDFEFVEGQRATALARPEGLILTTDAARRIFGDRPALGQTLLVDNDWEGIVTGVIAPLVQPSVFGHDQRAQMRFEMVGNLPRALDALPPFLTESYGSKSVTTLVRIPESMSREDFTRRLAEFAARVIPPPPVEGINWQAYPRSLKELMIEILDAQILPNGMLGLSIVVVLPGLGLLILVIAAINYAGLATTQALARYKEAGMRAVLGASRSDLFLQLWVETLLLTFGALVLALAIIGAALPVIEANSGINVLSFLTNDPFGIATVLGVTLLVSLLAAIYPAQRVMRIRPIEAIASKPNMGSTARAARVFVSLQFFSASLLLIVVSIMQMQQVRLRENALATADAPVAILSTFARAGIDYEAFEQRLASAPGIEGTTQFSRMPWTGSGLQADFTLSPDPSAATRAAMVKPVGYNFFATFSQDVLGGRVFDTRRNPAPDSIFDSDNPQPAEIVIDRIMMQSLGFASPQEAVGQMLYRQEVAQQGAPPTLGRPMRIVGVVSDDNWEMGIVPEGTVYYLSPGQGQVAAGLFAVRLDPRNVAAGLDRIARVWDEMAPNSPLRAEFFDELFEASMEPIDRVQNTVAALTYSAFAISIFGLFGIASYTTRRREKEIGIRKVLGARKAQIVRMLLADFAKPVIIGNLLAWPLGYVLANAYLAQFSDRIALTPLPFALAFSITLLVALATVGSRALKAASINPAAILKSE